MMAVTFDKAEAEEEPESVGVREDKLRCIVRPLFLCVVRLWPSSSSSLDSSKSPPSNREERCGCARAEAGGGVDR